MIPEGFQGRSKPIEDVDLPRIGHEIGVGEDVIHAIIDVEAPKVGFDELGRPRILFEPHIFYRYLDGEQRDRAVSEGLAYRYWKPGAYGPESGQYGKLARAMAINRQAALYACSWGRSQIMGFNHVAAGYATVDIMVGEFCDDEDNHIEAMIRFIKAKRLDDDLRRIEMLNRPSAPDDWRPVALGYNGGAYEANAYHIKLSSRFNWWRQKPDTPWSPEVVPAPAPVVITPEPEPIPTYETKPGASIPPPPDVEPTAPAPAAGFWARFFTAMFKG